MGLFRFRTFASFRDGHRLERTLATGLAPVRAVCFWTTFRIGRGGIREDLSLRRVWCVSG